MEAIIREEATKAAARLGLPARFIAAWWISENGWTWPSTNNVGNVSYLGEGVPSGGVFHGVRAVEANKVCVYETADDGVNAFVLLLETPKADKVLTVDAAELKACGEDIAKMAEIVGRSNWAASHYDDGHGPGSLILDVYHSPGVADAFDAAPKPEHAAAPVAKEGRHTVTVREGDTLEKLADRFRTTVRAFVGINAIEYPNVIKVDEELIVPVAYQVRAGDSLSAIAPKFGTTVERIARANAINPDRIYTGELLFV